MRSRTHFFALFILLVWPYAIQAQTVIDVNPAIASGQNFAPVQRLVLSDTSTAPATIITQTAEVIVPPPNGVLYPRSTPFNLVSARVFDPQLGPSGQVVDLSFISVVYDVVLRGFANDATTPNPGPTPPPTGGNTVRVYNADTSNTILAPNPTARNAWRQAAQNALASRDLLNYIDYNGNPAPLPPNGSPDWDVMFSQAFQPEDYLMIAERDGNTFFNATPLNAQGIPIPGANTLRYGCRNGVPMSSACNGGGLSRQEYDWNIGIAMTGYQANQPGVVTIASVGRFFQDTTIPPAQQRVFGLRIENKGGADVKFFGLALDSFDNNDPLPRPDYGSLPTPYLTTRATGGARHFFVNGDAFLGQLPPDREDDAELGGDNAVGLEDEDGVVLLTPWTPSANAQTIDFAVRVGAPGFLSLFIDQNAGINNTLVRATLQSVISGPAPVTIPGGGAFGDVFFSAAGVYNLRVVLPANSGISIATRWRITNAAGQGGNNSFAGASTGEVEDFIFVSDDAVPVSLAWLVSSLNDGPDQDMVVRWATASETGNVGFRFIDAISGLPLHQGLIESTVVDSDEVTEYEAHVARPQGMFYVEDVDIFGTAERHGPFAPGVEVGSRPVLEAIDWTGIRAELEVRESRESGQPQSGVPLRLETDVAGVHRLTHADLLAAGYDLAGISTDQLALTAGGDPVAFHTSAGATFEAGDWIEFIAAPSPTKYSRYNVYKLHVDHPDAHRRIADAGAADASQPAVSIHTEVAKVGSARRYGVSSPLADPWFDTQMTVTTAPKRWDFAFPVDLRDAAAAEATLQLLSYGITQFSDTQDDHHLIVKLNLQPVADLWFRGRELIDLEIAFDASLLVDGDNLLTLEMPADTGFSADVIAFKSAEIRYQRILQTRANELVFDVAGSRVALQGSVPEDVVIYRESPRDVVRIDPAMLLDSIFGAGFEAGEQASQTGLQLPGLAQGAQFHVRSAATLPAPRVSLGRATVDLMSTPADYLILAHPQFVDAVEPLANFHRQRGLTVRTIDVRDIYSQYAGGLADAHALQRFLRDAAGPLGYRYVLLAGGDTYDYRNDLNVGSVSFVPTLYAPSSVFANHAPSDGMLVDLTGNRVPDRAIGRMPARTVGEMETMVAKTLTYYGRDYRRRVALAGDERDGNLNFSAQSEQFIDDLGPDWSVRRSYLDQTTVALARDQIIAAFDEGQSLLTFAGHSASSLWTFKGLFSASNVALLAPLNRPTVVAQWGCWNTYHVNPTYNTMGHAFMLAEAKGAAAVLGSATFTYASSSTAFGTVLMPLLADPQYSIGEALMLAKQAFDPEVYRDVVIAWTILGDPALTVAD